MTPEDREPDAPDMSHAESHTHLHGHTGGVPPDQAHSDNGSPVLLCSLTETTTDRMLMVMLLPGHGRARD